MDPRRFGAARRADRLLDGKSACGEGDCRFAGDFRKKARKMTDETIYFQKKNENLSCRYLRRGGLPAGTAVL